MAVSVVDWREARICHRSECSNGCLKFFVYQLVRSAKMNQNQDPKDVNDSAAKDSPEGKEAIEAEQQERWAREHREQLRRMQCPGCGEDDIF